MKNRVHITWTSKSAKVLQEEGGEGQVQPERGQPQLEYGFAT